MILSISTFAAVLEYHQQNLSALVILFLAIAAAAAVRNWLWLSGFLLALSTIKAQISALIIIWFVLWAVGRWKERKHLVWSFGGTMAALLGAAEAVSPHWIGRFLRGAREYQNYAANPSILQVFFPAFAATLLALVLVILLIVLCWRWRKAAAGSADFGCALAWVGAVTLAILPKLSAYNHPLLIPPLLIFLAQYHNIKKASLITRAFTKAAFACQIWQWGSALALALCSLLISAPRLNFAAEVPLYTLLALSPVTLLAVVATTFCRRDVILHAASIGSPSPQTPAVPHE
jgi:hypothetical protein